MSAGKGVDGNNEWGEGHIKTLCNDGASSEWIWTSFEDAIPQGISGDCTLWWFYQLHCIRPWLILAQNISISVKRLIFTTYWAKVLPEENKTVVSLLRWLSYKSISEILRGKMQIVGGGCKGAGLHRRARGKGGRGMVGNSLQVQGTWTPGCRFQCQKKPVFKDASWQTVVGHQVDKTATLGLKLASWWRTSNGLGKLKSVSVRKWKESQSKCKSESCSQSGNGLIWFTSDWCRSLCVQNSHKSQVKVKVKA